MDLWTTMSKIFSLTLYTNSLQTPDLEADQVWCLIWAACEQCVSGQ